MIKSEFWRSAVSFEQVKKSKLKKRLRKKKHLGEFQEFGFEVAVNFGKWLNESEFDKFWYSFIREIEESKLMCGGGGDCKVWKAFITAERKFASPTNEDRERLRFWLENCFIVKNSKIGKLKNAWND